MLDRVRGKLDLMLKGVVDQFNASLMLTLTFVLIGFSLVNCLSDGITRHIGNATLMLIALGTVTVNLINYARRSPRANTVATPAIETTQKGVTVKLINPPDRLYEPAQVYQLLRMLSVGYDEDLCPDGEVLGDAADNKIRMLSAEEKTKFKEDHKREISSARQHIASKLLDTGSIEKA